MGKTGASYWREKPLETVSITRANRKRWRSEQRWSRHGRLRQHGLWAGPKISHPVIKRCDIALEYERVLETLQKDLDDVGTHVSMKEEKINQLYLEMKNYIIARKHNTWALAATLMNNESSTQLEDVTSIIKDNFDLRHFRPNTRHAHRERARGREKMEWKRGDKQRLGGIAVTLGAAIKSENHLGD
uniref:Uncharacterized protein n=1 Tax=Timema monikensis TaxID=170555 RepID=A0A7R9E7J0_9NEOP|nr:unnamed protein product [Timema monikensis]